MDTTTRAPRYVELIRVSSEGQADRDTPEVQRQALDALAQRRPGVRVERLESVVSGNASKRADLERLSALAASRAFDEIRVYRLDRLTRSADLGERVIPFTLAREAGARIVDCTGQEIDPRAPEGAGELLYFFGTFGAAREREKIRDRTMAGRARAAAAGRHPGGETPCGLRYSRATGWTVCEPEAEVVRRAARMVLTGSSLRDVSATLRAEGTPTRHGGEWSASAVHRLLTNPAASGRYEYGERVIPVPAILSPQEQDAVRVALGSHRLQSGPRPTIPALLRGALRCAECGSSLRVVTRWADRARTRRLAYYYCASAGAEYAAPLHYRPAHQVPHVDASVRDELVRVLSSEEVVRRAVEEMRSRSTSRSAARDLPRARAEVARLEAQERRTLALLGDEAVSQDVVRERLRDLARARTEAARVVADLEARAGAPASLDAARSAAARVLEAVERLSGAQWSRLVRLLVPEGLSVRPGLAEGLAVLDLGSASQASRDTGRTRQVGLPVRAELPRRCSRRR